MNTTKIEFTDLKPIERFKSGDWLFQWCCDCGLRHIWYFEIVRGKKPEDDEVLLRCTRDNMATNLRKFYNRHKKSKSKRKK